MRPICLALCAVLAAAPAAAQSPLVPVAAASVAPARALVVSTSTQETFLRAARIQSVRGVSKGVTGTQRATLTDGALTHDVSIQTIDQSIAKFESARRVEFNFRDYWGYNVAAYRLGVLLGLDMIPPSVARTFRSKQAAFTWWVDDVMMDEQARAARHVQPPDTSAWSAQIHVMRVFDELIANTDRNQGNILIDARWKLWMIDHSRAFRTTTALRAPAVLRRCDRALLVRLAALDAATLRAALGEYLTDFEIDAVLARRDRIVRHFDTRGPQALYDYLPSNPQVIAPVE